MKIQILPLAAIISIASAAEGNNWATYPSVAKTASINGLADRFYDQLPSCAQECYKKPTSSTPCPYWDTGCLCVIPTWINAVAACIAENCKGKDVASATDPAISACSAAGVWEPYLIINGAASTSLQEAAAAAATEAASSSKTSQPEKTSEATTEAQTSEKAESTAPATTAPPSSATETSAAETPAETSAAETSEAKQSEASKAPAHSESVSSAPAQSSQAGSHPDHASVSSFEGAAAGTFPAVVVGAAAGLAMLL